MIHEFGALSDNYDVIVIGSGAAGLAAAVFSCLKGQRTLLLERTTLIGGTTALSAATTWIPNSDHAREGQSGRHCGGSRALFGAGRRQSWR